MAKKEPAMKPNSSGVFEDNPSVAKTKVVRALAAKGYSLDRIVKATGISESDVKKMLVP